MHGNMTQCLQFATVITVLSLYPHYAESMCQNATEIPLHTHLSLLGCSYHIGQHALKAKHPPSLPTITLVTADVLHEIRNDMKTLLSEFNYQQQDLDVVKDDLGLLKFGFALLQDSNHKLSTDSIRQLFQLKNIAESQGESLDTLMDFSTILSTLETQSDGLVTTLDLVEMSADQCVESIQVAQHPCGGSGWKKVVDLDMANASHTCPMGWTETDYSKRTCGRTLSSPGSCSAAVFSVADISPSYSRVCGRISAYVFGGPDAFDGYNRLYYTSHSEFC